MLARGLICEWDLVGVVFVARTGDAGGRDELVGEGPRETVGVFTGVAVVENTTAGGRQPYGLIGSVAGGIWPCSSDADGEGTAPGIEDE